MRSTLASLVCVVVLASCVTTYQVELDGFKLHQRSRALRSTGKAVVDASLVINGSSSVSDSKPYAEPVTIDQAVTDKRGNTRWIRDLLRGCADDDYAREANADCELDKPMTYYYTRSWEKRSTTRFVQLTLGSVIGGALIGAAACAGMCPDDTAIRTASQITAGVTAALFIGVVVWGILDCAGKWGQPGCRD